MTKAFGGKRVVDDLTLEIPVGSIYGFIGPNGSGKTTTLRLILHILYPDSGTIEILGERRTRPANDRIGYLPEERGLYRKMKAAELLAYYGALKGMSRRDARRAALSWLERLGLGEWAGKKIEALSKGMAQKVQFAASVVAGPELLILDEPFSGLDPVNLEVIRESVLELRQAGTTVVLSTHDMAMAERMCDFLFMIFRGKKVLDGTLAAIRETYGADTVRLRLDGGAGGGRELLHGHPAVESVVDMGRYQEVRVRGDHQELLRSLAARTRVEQFEVAQPSLHDIFVRIAGDEAAQALERGAESAPEAARV